MSPDFEEGVQYMAFSEAAAFSCYTGGGSEPLRAEDEVLGTDAVTTPLPFRAREICGQFRRVGVNLESEHRERPEYERWRKT